MLQAEARSGAIGGRVSLKAWEGAPHGLWVPTQLTLTMASLVCAMSEMTPSVMMRSTEYWEPSCTSAAFLVGGQGLFGRLWACHHPPQGPLTLWWGQHFG